MATSAAYKPYPVQYHHPQQFHQHPYHQQRSSQQSIQRPYAATHTPTKSTSQQQQQQQQQPWVNPPFAGPPPIPQGYAINPQQWQAGFWQYNPAYNPNRAQAAASAQQQQQQQQHALWLPSHAWASRASQQAQQTQQQSFNPYKRQVKEPSPEYLATKLSDNPLGLSNMIPAEELERQKAEAEAQANAQTPWIWKPRSLDDDDEDQEKTPSRKNTDPSSELPSSFTAKVELQPTFSPSIIRTPNHYKHDATPPPAYSSQPGSRTSLDSLSSRFAQMSTSPTPLSRHSSMPNTLSANNLSPTKPDFPPPPMLTTQISDEPDSILSPLVLFNKPMPKIQSSSQPRPLRQHHTQPVISTSSGLDTIPESNFGSGKHSTPKHPGNPVHANSMPAIPTYYTSPSSSSIYAPPAIPQSGPPPQPFPKRDWDADRSRHDAQLEKDKEDRERAHFGIGSRHTTYIDTPATGAPSYQHQYPPRGYRSQQQQQQQQQQPVSPTTPSPRSAAHSRSSSRHSSRQPSPIRRSSSGGTCTTTPPSSNPSPLASSTSSIPKMANPLPQPPQPFGASHGSSHTQVMHVTSPTPKRPVTHPQPTSPPIKLPSKSPKRVRKGFWNRRGDHLTEDGYIIYAPDEHKFPPELSSYPLPTDGFQDHTSMWTRFCPRPELPGSAPGKNGEPPKYPYELFIKYI
ncbi:hypothetical protein CVT24_001294 [Panaeolus cyanescens]|uniref:Uncharacterized protein n=1 Tax=Panaeolus cyanescens TaxID=181874 RepID=A0A409YYY6_9AGAR|nr:hypothetical protein CVT24_001294 [Panaeolus cyanescens]